MTELGDFSKRHKELKIKVANNLKVIFKIEK